MEEITYKLDIKNFCSVKDNAKRTKRQTTDWQNIFAKDILDKGLLSKIHKNLNRHLTKDNIWKAIKLMKACSISDVTREIDIKMYHATTQIKWSEVTQSCLTLCNPMDHSLPGSSVHGIFQAIVLEWTAISFSRGSSRPRDRTWVSRIVDRHFTGWATREVQISAVATELEKVSFHSNPKERQCQRKIKLLYNCTHLTP